MKITMGKEAKKEQSYFFYEEQNWADLREYIRRGYKPFPLVHNGILVLNKVEVDELESLRRLKR